MRVDFESVLNVLDRNGAKVSKLRKRMEEIAQLEEYTLLLPPYKALRVKELLMAAQNQEMLDFKFPKDYGWFMQCCDGGWLFTNQIFSLDDEEDEDNDLITANLYYREERMIPESCVAIGRTNYGAFIILRDDQTMALWDLEEEAFIAEYADIYEWLDDVLNEARYLLNSGDLPLIEEIDEEEGEVDGDG